MEVNFHKRISSALRKIKNSLSGALFVKKVGTEKKEVRFSSFKWLAVGGLVLFVSVVLFMPDDGNFQFSQKARMPDTKAAEGQASGTNGIKSPQVSEANTLWASPHVSFSGRAQVNHNTPMLIGPKGGNAKTQVRAGQRMPFRILDKFVVSQDQVPVLAELIVDAMTDSGLKLPAGTRFYGEASFQKGAERATIQFTQLSLPSGEIKKISGIAVGKDGQAGMSGHVFSDGMKNTAGQLLTTFVGGLASGSMQTDLLGHSRGGLENGLLNAVSQTAQTRAQMYGQKLQTEREWIEVAAGTEADAVLNDSLNLQNGGEQ